MRKLTALMLALILALCCVCAQAEEEQDNFIVSDWILTYSYEGAEIAEQTVFIYDGGTFAVMDDDEKAEGTWTFDGETLTLTGGEQTITLTLDADGTQLTGEYNSMTVTLTRPIEPESETGEEQGEEPAGNMLEGGWNVGDPAITDEVTALVEKALTGLVGVNYVPVAYLGAQVVAGTNHAVLCQATVVAPDTLPYWAILYLYEDLQGNVSISKIEELTLNAQPDAE